MKADHSLREKLRLENELLKVKVRVLRLAGVFPAHFARVRPPALLEESEWLNLPTQPIDFFIIL